MLSRSLMNMLNSICDCGSPLIVPLLREEWFLTGVFCLLYFSWLFINICEDFALFHNKLVKKLLWGTKGFWKPKYALASGSLILINSFDKLKDLGGVTSVCKSCIDFLLPQFVIFIHVFRRRYIKGSVSDWSFNTFRANWTKWTAGPMIVFCFYAMVLCPYLCSLLSLKRKRGVSPTFLLYHKLISRKWLGKKQTFETWTSLTPLCPFPVLGH